MGLLYGSILGRLTGIYTRFLLGYYKGSKWVGFEVRVPLWVPKVIYKGFSRVSIRVLQRFFLGSSLF